MDSGKRGLEQCCLNTAAIVLGVLKDACTKSY